jgi:hypothetical protein
VTISRIETMLTFHPLLRMRAALVAGLAATLGLLALANLSPSASPNAAEAMRQLRAPIAAPVAYSFAGVSGR